MCQKLHASTKKIFFFSVLYPPLGGSKKNLWHHRLLSFHPSLYTENFTPSGSHFGDLPFSFWCQFWSRNTLRIGIILVQIRLTARGHLTSTHNINKILKMRSAHFKNSVFFFSKNISKAILQHASELISKNWTLAPGFAFRRSTHRVPCWRQDCEDTETRMWPI